MLSSLRSIGEVIRHYTSLNTVIFATSKKGVEISLKFGKVGGVAKLEGD